MRFEQTLKNSIYEPWKSNYIDYTKLKELLRENDSSEKGEEWTEADEERFVEELLSLQMEKVNESQAQTYKSLQERTSECEARLEKLTKQDHGTGQDSSHIGDQEEKPEGKEKYEEDEKPEEIMEELDAISKEINELEKYSRINFTGFLKAAKKHDRRRGMRYKVRPMTQVRLAALPFNSEDYSPLLYRYEE